MELCGGERGLIAVLGGDDAADECGIGNQFHAGCGRGNALPLQHGQTVVDAPNGFPVCFVQLAEQVGLHSGESEGFGVADLCTLGNAAGEVIAVGQGIVRTGGKCAGFTVATALNLAGGIAFGNAGCRCVHTCRITGRCHISGVVAIGDGNGTAAAEVTCDTSCATIAVTVADDRPAVAAFGDRHSGDGCADNATCIAAAALDNGHSGLIAAAFDGAGRGFSAGQNTGGVACAADSALNNDVFDCGSFCHAEETGVVDAGDVQPGNGMALSVKAAGEFVEVLADGGEGAAAQIDVVGEDGIDGRNGRCVVDLVGQPCQLLTVRNLIGGSLRALTGGLGLGRAVPRSGGDQGNGNDLILGNGEGIAHLGVALGFDRVGVFAVREEIAAVGFRADGLPVPENGDGGVDVRRGDVKGDRALFYGRESDGLDRTALDGDFAGLCLVAESGDSVVIFAVGESERPVAAGMRTGLPINGDLGICGVNRESDGIGGDLPTEDGVAVIDARRSGDERLAQRGGQRLQFVGVFGLGVGVGAEGVEVVAVGDASAALFAEGRLYIAVASDGSCGVAIGRRSSRIFDSASNAAGITVRRRDCNIATVIGIFQRYGVIQIADQSADIAAACDLAEVCAGVYRFCAGGFYAAYDATNVCAAGDICFIHTVFHRTRTGQLTNDTCGVASPFNAAAYGQVLHGAAVDIAKQGLIGRSTVDLQILDLIALTVKGAFVGVTGIFPDRRPFNIV